MRSKLYRLSELNNYKVKSKDPDVRDWTLRGKHKLIGRVTELIVDVKKRKVVFLEVLLDVSVHGREDAYILLPIERVEFLQKTKEIIAPDITGPALEIYPAYDNRIIGPDYMFRLENYYELIKDGSRLRNVRYSLYMHKEGSPVNEFAKDPAAELAETELRMRYLECQKQLKIAQTEKDLAALERDIALAQLKKDQLATEVVINREVKI